MQHKRELILDTETTGLDLDGGDKIIEIGIIEIVENIRTGNNYQVYINPNKKIEKSALNIHGLSNEFLKDKPHFYEIVDEFINYIGDSRLVIHNADFDKNFLNHELENCGKPKLKNEILDTLMIAKKEFPSQSVSLDSLCKRLNIDNSNRKLHGALLDADLLTSVYLKMTTGKQTKLELKSKEIKRNVLKKTKTDFTNKIITVRENLLYLPGDEYQEHIKFMKKFTTPVWDKIKDN